MYILTSAWEIYLVLCDWHSMNIIYTFKTISSMIVMIGTVIDDWGYPKDIWCGKDIFCFLTVVFMGSSAVKEWEILVLFLSSLLFYFLRWRRWGLYTDLVFRFLSKLWNNRIHAYFIAKLAVLCEGIVICSCSKLFCWPLRLFILNTTQIKERMKQTNLCPR